MPAPTLPGAPGGLLADAGLQPQARLLYDRIAKVTPFIRYVRGYRLGGQFAQRSRLVLQSSFRYSAICDQPHRRGRGDPVATVIGHQIPLQQRPELRHRRGAVMPPV
jgi:hypothetical protein